MNGPLDPVNPKPVQTGTPPVPGPGNTPPPVTPEDAGSQALSEALRSSFAIVKVVMVLLVIVFLASGVFTVPSQEQAIKLRFGRPVGTGKEQLLGPGLHWSFPYPIDEVVRIPISEVQTVTSTAGWYATTPEAEATNSEPPAGPTLNPVADGYTLTGDNNIIHVRVQMRYRINDALQYTLGFVNASNLVQNALNEALLYAAPRFTVDQALRLKQTEFKEQIVERVRQLVEQQGLGITVEDASLRTMAPRYLASAFDDAKKADVTRQELTTRAQADAAALLAKVEGDAKAATNAAEADRGQLVQALAAEAKYFDDQLPYYRKNPELFMARLQIETMQRILANAQYKVLRMDDAQRTMRLQVSREPPKAGQQQPGQSPSR